MTGTLLAVMLGATLISSPHTLRTELIEDTHTVYSNGYPTNASLSDVKHAWSRGNNSTYQLATIATPNPGFSWQLPAGFTDQYSYRILVASSPDLLAEGKADVWDSGDVVSPATSGIVCLSDGIKPASVYYWTVKVVARDGSVSAYAEPQSFLTARQWEAEYTRMPLVKKNQEPVAVVDDENCVFADFGKAAFGQLTLTVKSSKNDTITIHLGEDRDGNRVNRNPGGTIRYTRLKLPVRSSDDTYTLVFKPDGRNAAIKPHGKDVRAVLMPDYIGEVYPFRYCEIENGDAEIVGIKRDMVHYPWNDDASYFHSSDSILNAVWDLCKYSILATTYTGVYVDGDRERIPYEADALVNQLCHYSVDSDLSMGRYSVDYVLDNGTWPTEWILQGPIIAWNDYLYTGDNSLLKKNYDRLKARTLVELTEDNGLISTRTGRQTPELLRRCGYYGDKIDDIVDWPRSGTIGVGKDGPGEADGYELLEYNTVVNAYHYRALVLMSLIADAVGNRADALEFSERAAKVKDTINSLLFDKKRRCYRDGIGTDHCSLHASMYPMAFGLVPDKYKADVMDHIKSRGMACSVFGSQFLLDALYDGGLDDYALSLMVDKGKRGWWNMIETGSTITWEAWDKIYKPNLDWNHAWGAAPANIIPRKLMGIEPLEAGWSRMRIKPQPGNLEYASIKVPTIKGPVAVSFDESSGSFVVDVEIPAGAVSEMYIPSESRRYKLSVNDRPFKSRWENGFATFELPAGSYKIVLSR